MGVDNSVDVDPHSANDMEKDGSEEEDVSEEIEQSNKTEPKRKTLFDKFRSQNALKKKINNEEGVTGNKTSYIGSREAEEKKEILIKDKPRTAQIVEPLFKKEKEEVKEMK